MNNSSLSNEDLEDQCYPLYLILKDHKTNNEIMIFEAYRFLFIPMKMEINMLLLQKVITIKQLKKY